MCICIYIYVYMFTVLPSYVSAPASSVFFKQLQDRQHIRTMNQFVSGSMNIISFRVIVPEI